MAAKLGVGVRSPVVRRLEELGVRNFRRSFGRFALTATGVMLGVAVLLAVQVANASASRAFDRRYLSLARPTVRLEAADENIPEATVRQAASLPHVFGVYGSHGFMASLD